MRPVEIYEKKFFIFIRDWNGEVKLLQNIKLREFKKITPTDVTESSTNDIEEEKKMEE